MYYTEDYRGGPEYHEVLGEVRKLAISKMLDFAIDTGKFDDMLKDVVKELVRDKVKDLPAGSFVGGGDIKEAINTITEKLESIELPKDESQNLRKALGLALVKLEKVNETLESNSTDEIKEIVELALSKEGKKIDSL